MGLEDCSSIDTILLVLALLIVGVATGLMIHDTVMLEWREWFDR